MVIQFVITFFIILSVWLVNICYISPKRQISKYKRLFETKGYRVYQFPYKPFTYPIIQTIYKDSLQGDAFYSYKNIFCNYDVLIGNQLNRPSISLFNPELRKQFAKVQRDYVYQKLKDFTKQQARFAGYGLIFSEGEDWKRKRRIMGSLFTYDFIKDYVPDIQKICLKNIQKAELKAKKIIQNGQQKLEYDLGDMASQIFSQVIVSLFMGLKALNLTINGVSIGKFILELANDANMQAKGLLPLLFGIKFLDWGITKKHRQVNERLKLLKNWINSFINNQINEYQRLRQSKQTDNKNSHKNILSIHLKTNLQKYKKNQTQVKKIPQSTDNLYNKQQLISELKNFAIAGTDTSVNFFRMMVYYISQNPQVQSKLRKQLKQFINQPITFETLKKLKYLQAIQKQTTRMFGPTNFNFPRRVLKDHYIDGVPIRKETIIQYHTICTHYNSQFYQQPHKFKPERWLNIPQDQKNLALLIGFGLGPRNCIGQHLASTQSKIAIIKFYQHYSNVTINNDKICYKWKFLYKPDNFNVKVKIQNQ